MTEPTQFQLDRLGETCIDEYQTEDDVVWVRRDQAALAMPLEEPLLNLKEAQAVLDLAKRLDVSVPQVLKQALRVYQLQVLGKPEKLPKLADDYDPNTTCVKSGGTYHTIDQEVETHHVECMCVFCRTPSW